MKKILACRVLSREIDHLHPDIPVDYFEPLCHKMREQKFVEYVDSQLLDHQMLVCGNCGGLAGLATSRGRSIPPADDCIDLLIGDVEKELKTLYLTDGWIEYLDMIFGLERIPNEARKSVLGAIFSPIRKVIYISTEASGKLVEKARELADLLGCEFGILEGSTSEISRYLGDVE
jgi:hypothetical protein